MPRRSNRLTAAERAAANRANVQEIPSLNAYRTVPPGKVRDFAAELAQIGIYRERLNRILHINLAKLESLQKIRKAKEAKEAKERRLNDRQLARPPFPAAGPDSL